MLFGNLVQRSVHAVINRLFDVGDTLEHQSVIFQDSPAEWLIAWTTDVHSVSVQISAISKVNDIF